MTMLFSPKKLVGAVADVTVGTAIVLVHVMLAERDRVQVERSAPEAAPLAADRRGRAATDAQRDS